MDTDVDKHIIWDHFRSQWSQWSQWPTAWRLFITQANHFEMIDFSPSILPGKTHTRVAFCDEGILIDGRWLKGSQSSRSQEAITSAGHVTETDHMVSGPKKSCFLTALSRQGSPMRCLNQFMPQHHCKASQCQAAEKFPPIFPFLRTC